MQALCGFASLGSARPGVAQHQRPANRLVAHCCPHAHKRTRTRRNAHAHIRTHARACTSCACVHAHKRTRARARTRALARAPYQQHPRAQRARGTCMCAAAVATRWHGLACATQPTRTRGPATGAVARHPSQPPLFGEAVLMMELPRRHSTPLEGGRFAPIKSSNYGGRPLTGPRPDDLVVLGLVEWPGWVNE